MKTSSTQTDPHSRHQATLPPRWRWWLAAIPPGGVLVILLLFLMGSIFYLGFTRYTRRQIEAMKMPSLQGVALVEQKMERSRYNADLSITFSLQGHYIRCSTIDDKRWQKTEPGDRVPVIYHISKEGEYFIESWEPVVHPQKAPLHP